MHALSARELLDVWERGLPLGPTRRGLALLASACPDSEPEALARLPVGERDALLLDLREATFGSEFASLTFCPFCGEKVELTFRAAAIRATPPEERTDIFTLCVEGCEVRFRLPNSLDMEALSAFPDVEEARRFLLERCLLAAERDGEPLAAAQLPPEVMQAISERMAEADPQADVQLACVCPQCSAAWNTTFDIVSYLWTEIADQAVRLLRDIHRLASAYSWREADILAMSASRRSLYLELIENE